MRGRIKLTRRFATQGVRAPCTINISIKTRARQRRDDGNSVVNPRTRSSSKELLSDTRGKEGEERGKEEEMRSEYPCTYLVSTEKITPVRRR